jgi:hypothetical protein
MRLTALLSIALLASCALAQAKPKAVAPVVAAPVTSPDLPVKRVVLYKNGVGYFEHAGRVSGTQELRIQFTTAQLNDVLKSFTVVDLGGGQITGVRYDSIAPLSERLSTLRVQLGENTSRMEFLRALRGARVEVRSGTTSAVGRLLSVESVRRETEKGQLVDSTQFGIMTDSGELRTFELTPSVSVRIAEADLNKEVGQYLNAVSSVRAKDVRRMNFTSVGTGSRDVFVSYISEVPVWKSTYRIVMPKDTAQKPLLQGWAIIDNTVGEDWKDVQLSLVAGAPQSFTQPISQPLYVRRPSIELPKQFALAPQTHEAAMIVDAPPPPPPPPSSATSPSQYGYAIGGVVGQDKSNDSIHGVSRGPNMEQTVEVSGEAPIVNATASNVFIAKRSAGINAEAEGAAIGDLFEYNLKQHITVLKNQSALVPIVQSRIEADKVTLLTMDENEDDVIPLRALWLKNSSGLTLDAGTFNIIEGDSFAGEGLIDELHPDERRLISYAADTAVKVDVEDDSENRPVTHISIAKGLLKYTREQREKKTYTIRNTDTAARQVVIEHPARDGWKLVKELKPEETSTTHHRFRVAVEPNKTAALTVEEFHPEETSYALTNIDSNMLVFISNQRTLKPELDAALRRVLAKKAEISGVQTEMGARRGEVGRISGEQARLRENMKALKGSAEEKALVQRYVQDLNKQEDRLVVLNREIGDLESQTRKLGAELDLMVQSITFDEDI